MTTHARHRRCCRTPLAALAAFCLNASLAMAADNAPLSHSGRSEWPMFGQNTANTASGVTLAINSHNVHRLEPKWTFTTAGDVSARAAVVRGGVYFPDWGGQLYRLDSATGAVVWSKNLMSDYGFTPASGSTKVVSRTSPAVDRGTVYIGTQATATGAYLLAIDTSNGALRWKTQLDTHPLSADTTSPVVLNGVVYLGVSSLEEFAAANPQYPCCSSRGSVVAVNAATGALIWKQFMVPPGYTGAPVWGSTLVPDPIRGLLYVTTGNNYAVPADPAFAACVGKSTAEDKFTSCLSPDDHIDSVLALDMKSGSVRWSHRLSGADDWTTACIGLTVGQGNCPDPIGLDYDFGSGTNLFTVATPKGPRQILGAGQKSGLYSAFDPGTGRLLWATQVGPGSIGGGIEWGSATDGQRIYVASANFNGEATPAGNAGSWVALDPLTGKILWQTADPAKGAGVLGPVTVANGVVYAGSMAGAPSAANMLALDARTGAVLWSFAAGGSVVAGAAIADDTIYWGSGYSNLPIPGWTTNNKFYAFSLDGK
jgi:polyvinyl alcohol dehydrogenase (cytochrome)